MAGLLWILLIGFVAGTIARLLMPGPNTPKGFILTTVLGIAGAALATFVGTSAGWYTPHHSRRIYWRRRRRGGYSVHLAPAGGLGHHPGSRRLSAARSVHGGWALSAAGYFA